MITRKTFLKNSVMAAAGIASVSGFGLVPFNSYGRNGKKSGNKFLFQEDNVKYDLSLNSPTRYFDGEFCFVHPRAGIVPGAGVNGLPRVVMTMTSQDLTGSDVFRAAYSMQTDDFGKTWTTPQEISNLAPRYEVINNERRPVALSDYWPQWHKKGKVLLGTGHTVVYTPDWRVVNPRPRHTSYSIYNPKDNSWSVWQKMEMPDKEKFYDCGAGSTQRYDKPDGTILLPVYFRPPGAGTLSTVTVVRCTFYDNKLRYLEHGSELSVDIPRGLGEPALTFFKGEYFLTLRNDKTGYVTKGNDGLIFNEPKPWTFDDGENLGNYNTQQHWVTHSDGLFLVYTRRGANNDHIFRHRAPLFIARVDPERLCVMRDTERILVPERGTRIGNFGVTDVSKDETWVTTSEWMQPRGVEKYGSDGSVFVARIHWDKPNRLFSI